MAEYNHELCVKLHADIEHRLERGDETMNAIYKLLRGNGDIGIVTRVDRIEQAFARNQSLLWRVLTPALPIIYGIIAAAIVLYLQS
jgi:hypothetical protein